MDLRAQQTRNALEGSAAGTIAAAGRPDAGPLGGTAEVVHRGEFHRLGRRRSRHRVSVLMPLMDAGAALRQTLPLLLEQEVDAELEIVAVDSASTDDTVEVLEEFGATVLAIDPSEFDHGLTRNLLGDPRPGRHLVLLNGRSRPCDESWLAPAARGRSPRTRASPGSPAESFPIPTRTCSPGATSSSTRAAPRCEPSSGSTTGGLRGDAGRAAPAAAQLPYGQRRDPGGRAAPDPLPLGAGDRRGPALVREVLEAGLALVHEPDSRVYHSHDYSLREWFMRNVDDGVANSDINERSLSEEETDALVRGMIESDWAYLRDELGSRARSSRRWQIQAALRRTAQAAGQWLGVNHAPCLPRRSRPSPASPACGGTRDA